jgi:hypothetical protein
LKRILKIISLFILPGILLCFIATKIHGLIVLFLGITYIDMVILSKC